MTLSAESSASNGTGVGQEYGAEGDVARHLFPPFDLTSDMLFVAGLCPTGPLRAAFPGEPFLSIRGSTPLVAWFSVIKEVCYTNAAGERQCMGEHEPQNELGQTQEGAERLYNELNVMAPLRRRAFFVPGIYATSKLTIQVGRSQGMPKEPTIMSLRVKGHQFRSEVVHGARRSGVRARLVGSGRLLGRLLSVAWPVRIWPAIFPSSSYVRASILGTPRAQLAHVRPGTLSVEAEWLPRAVKLFPLGLYLPDLRMRLPQSRRLMPTTADPR